MNTKSVAYTIHILPTDILTVSKQLSATAELVSAFYIVQTILAFHSPFYLFTLADGLQSPNKPCVVIQTREYDPTFLLLPQLVNVPGKTCHACSLCLKHSTGPISLSHGHTASRVDHLAEPGHTLVVLTSLSHMCLTLTRRTQSVSVSLCTLILGCNCGRQQSLTAYQIGYPATHYVCNYTMLACTRAMIRFEKE
jgi:hypothetical protein